MKNYNLQNELISLSAPITAEEERLIPLFHDGNIPFWILEYGELRKRTDEELLQIYTLTHPEKRDERIAELNQALHAYLNAHYDAGVQITFLSIYTELLEKDSLTTRQQTAKDRIKAAWDFVKGSVLVYYDLKKAELETTANFFAVKWDFDLLNEHDPAVSLREIMLLNS